MHTVIQSHCTGCELCLPVCPTDCIQMQVNPEIAGAKSDWPGYTPDDITLAKVRYEQRQARLTKQSSTKPDARPLGKAARQQAILDVLRRKQQST